MYTRRCLLLGLLVASLLPAQDAQPSVQVTGAVKQALTLSAEDLAKMPRASVRTTNNGMETVYEGVWLYEVLKKAGVPQGEQLRGQFMATYVLVEAADNYRVLFSLEEFNSSFMDSEIIVADTMDGAPIPGALGPFRLIAPHEKRPARWVEMLKSLTVVRVPN